MSKITEKQKLVIAENRESNRKTVRFDEDGTITWVNSANKATKFESLEEVEVAISTYFKDDDFGLGVFKVLSVQQGDYWIYIKGGQVERVENKLKIEDVTNEFIYLSTMKEDEIDILKVNEAYLYQNREEVRRMIFYKIGTLIDLHNKCDKQYAPTALFTKDKKSMHCQGCIICDRIDAYADMLDKAPMSKFYKYLIGEERGRFVEFKGKGRGISDTLDENSLSKLAYLMRDYVALRKNEFSMKEIADFWGIGITLFYKYYDSLADSEYCFVVGRKRRSSKTDKDYNRTQMDPWF